MTDITLPGTQNYFERSTSKVYDLYLNNNIESAENYKEWNQLFRSATPNDVIYMHINSYGGDLNTAIQMVRAMRECEGTIVTSIEGACMSAATVLFLQGDICEVSDHSQFMVHTYSGASWGKGSEIVAQVLHDNDWIANLFQDIYRGFLTDAEIDSVIAGTDMWMTPEDVFARLKKRAALLEKEAKAEEKSQKNPPRKRTPRKSKT